MQSEFIKLAVLQGAIKMKEKKEKDTPIIFVENLQKKMVS